MIMEERPDTLLVKELVCESRSDDGAAVWHARLLVAAGPGQMHEEEVRALVSAAGEVSLLGG
jgi:hypothetical protein